MNRPGLLGERPRGSRIDDRRPTHISASPETAIFGRQPPPRRPGPPRRDATLGALAHRAPMR